MVLKVKSFKIPYTIENGELVLDEDNKEELGITTIDDPDQTIIKLSSQLGADNAQEKDLALAVPTDDNKGFIILKYLV